MKYQLVKIGWLGVGQIFGENDAICSKGYSNTM